MRAKRRTRRRAADSDKKVAGEFGTADWVLVNQGGWGPYSALALLAGIAVAARAVAWQVGRIAATIGRAPRRRRD